MEPRSWLFVPGDSERKLAKSLDSGADAVIIDLEDSVAVANKPAAREIAGGFLGAAAEGGPALWVRVNPIESDEIEADLAAMAAMRPAGLVLPKCEGPQDVERLAAMIVALGCGSLPIHAIVTETPRAVFRLGAFAECCPAALAAISWGAEDLAAAIGASGNRHAAGEFHATFAMARSLALLAAHAAGVQAIDTLYADFRDDEGLRLSSEQARAEGFSGRLAIHPAQVPIINSAFAPSPAELAWAERIVEAFAVAGSVGTVGIDGRMIDRPHLVQAQKLLARAGSQAGGCH